MPASHVEERPFALRRTAAYEFIEGLNRTKEALHEQGFDIATTFDTGGALGGACTILGVCDADLLRRAIKADAEAGVFLPCSVAVHESEEGIVVEAVDPRATLGGAGNEALVAIAAEVRERLVKALNRLPPGSRR